MIQVITALNGENGDVKISINTTLIGQYFSNLKGLTLNHKDCPKNLTVERAGTNTAIITVSSGIDVNNIDMVTENGMAGIPRESAVVVQTVLNIVKEFIYGAIQHSIKKVEFIPLYDFSGDVRNYSLDEMKEDVVTAMKNKRNLCVIDKFQSYLDNNVTNKYCFNQYMIDYEKNSDEYTDFILLARNGKLDELRKKYSGKLTKTEWF